MPVLILLYNMRRLGANMRTASFAIETTGNHHDRDSIVSLEGIMFDHVLNQVTDRFRYDIIGEMHIVNEMIFPPHEAARMVKEWFSSDCYYFSLNADKGKHFLRKLFFYQYLNPFEHERHGKQNKIVDAMAVLRAAHHIGELSIELPVSPLGEVSYEMKAIGKLNFPRLSELELIARILHQVISSGGKAFRLIKSQMEKNSLYLKGGPIVYLKGIDKEIGVIPKVIYPIGQSTTNRNRFFFYEPNELIKTPMEALEGYFVSRNHKLLGEAYRECKNEVFYLDTNKSDLVLSLNDTSVRYQLDHLRVHLPPKKRLSIKDITSIYKKIEEIDRIYHREGDGSSFYEARLSYGYVRRWNTIRNFLLAKDVNKALHEIGDEIDRPIELRRLRYFLSQLGVGLDEVVKDEATYAKNKGLMKAL